MATNVTLHAGHDVAYFTSGQGCGGCAGAMSYYTAAGEPPGQWTGKGARALGLAGQVDPGVIGRLYQHNIRPGGELLVKRRQSKASAERECTAVAAYLAAHPYASTTELAEVRAAERGTDPHQVPYFDLTVSAAKSVSVLHASYRVAARQACESGEQDQAAALDARADELESALMDSAREAVAWLEQHATYTRTGHPSSRTGEWRDGDGLVAGLFLHHLSRDGDPQLHVHIAIWNRVQRADGADAKWRTLDSRTLHNQRLAVAPVADRILETKLSALGYAMVPRADGNGAEVGGISQDVMDLFSSRAVAVTGELDRLAREYEAAHGKPPSRRTLWLLHQQAGQNTRRTKAQAWRTIAGQTGTAGPTAAQRLAAWEAQTARREVQALSAVHEQVAEFAAERAGRARAVLDDAAKRTAARIAVAQVQKQHAVWSMAQLRFEVHRVLPVLPPGADGEAVVTEVARLAVSGRSGAEVVQITAPDITDVTSLGVRASDSGSIYRPPNEERYCTLAHLDTEEQILAAARRTVPQLVSQEQARATAERAELNAEQREAVVMMLTAAAATTVLIAPAGAGKSHTMAEFARLWTTFTGRRVIGLTTSAPPGPALDYAHLFEASPSPYLIMTADFTIITVNRAYADATMIDPQAVAGRPMFEIFPDNPDDPHADGVRNLRRSLQAVVDTGRPDALALQRYDVRAPDGRFVERYWSPVNTPVLADDGSVAFIIHRVQDVTDLVELRRAGREHQHAAAVLRTQVEQMEADLFTRGRELQDTNLELQRVNAELAAASAELRAQQHAKDQFIASLSHELRNPLASARAALDVLGLDVPDHPARAVLNRQLTALTRITDDLLEAARVATGTLPATRHPLDLRPVVTATVHDIQAAHPGLADIRVTVPATPVTLNGDPVRLAQMIANLLDNADKHTPPARRSTSS